jgi:hypothetical protein
MKSVKIGNLDIPEDYFVLSKNEKDVVCMMIYDDIMILVDRQLPKYISRVNFIDKIIDSSLITNLNEEKYEVAAVLKDLKELIKATNE